MNSRTIFAGIAVISLIFVSIGWATEVTYELEDLGSGQWVYHYTVINSTLGEPIRQFIIWFEPGLYENLSIVSEPRIGYDWYQDTVEPDPVWLFYGAYRAFAWGDGISVDDYESGFAVTFTYLGEGVPGCQEFDVVDPIEYVSLEFGLTYQALWVDASAAGNPIQTGAYGEPFAAIQPAINDANDGYIVYVAPGLYEESIDFLGKAITVKSHGATMDNPAVISGTGSNAVKFINGETPETIIEGFVITSSSGGRGIACGNYSSPTIRDNLIVNCGSMEVPPVGSALYVDLYCHPIIMFNTITDNYGYETAVYVRNNDGDGFSPSISHCIIYNNSNFSNFDLWIVHPEEIAPGSIEYCDIGTVSDPCWLDGAEVDAYGNFSKPPRFVRQASDGGDGWFDHPDTLNIDESANNIPGDYHLRSESPCINAGDPCYVPWAGQMDGDGQGRIILGRVDIGVDEVAPNTEVTKPTGGEVWSAGSSHEIRWESFGIGDVDIYYSRNNVADWLMIEAGVANTGSYDWQLPAVNSDECLVWVAASVEPEYIEYAYSGVFTIHPSEPGPVVESAWPTLGADSARRGLSSEAGPEVGCIKWQFETEGSFYNSVAVGADGRVHIASEDGKLYTVDPNTGTAIWIFDANSPMTSSPTVGADGTVYVGCMNGRLYAIDKDGQVRWTYDTGSFIYSTPAIAAGSDGEVYFGSQDGKLYALGSDGSEVWSFETAGPGQVGGAILASPTIGKDGSIYIAGVFDSKLYALPGPSHDPNDGTPRWVHDFDYLVDANDYEGLPLASPAVGPDGTIYMLLPNPINLYALSPADGSIIWAADGAEYLQGVTDSYLQGHWEFETDASDSSGYGRDGVLVGGASIVSDPFRGNVLLLSGDPEHVEIPGYKGVTGTDPRTISAWIRPAPNVCLVSWGFNGSYEEGMYGDVWKISIMGDESIRVYVPAGVAYTYVYDFFGSPTPWHHLAVVWEDDGTPDAADVKFYLDGVQANTVTAYPDPLPVNTGDVADVWIGASPWIPGRTDYLGKIDDFRIYDRALTAAEIFGTDPDAYCWQRPAIGPDGTIYVSFDDNYLRAFNPDGSIKWVNRVGMGGGFTLAVDKDGLIYAASEDGSLYVMNSSGTAVARFDGGDWLSQPVIGQDGTIYVCDVDNNVLAIDRYACAGETVDLHWAGDFNSDGAVNFDDVIILASDWMACGSSTIPLASDSDRNMYVDLTDFAAVVAKWLDEI